MAARASGVDADFRRDHPHDAYEGLRFEVPVEEGGDVRARLMVRAREVEQSLVDPAPGPRRAARRAARGADCPTQLPARASALGWVEAWRGPCTHWVATDERGDIARVKVTDPSFLELAGARARGAGQHHPGLPGDQQELQPLVFRQRSLERGRKTHVQHHREEPEDRGPHRGESVRRARVVRISRSSISAAARRATSARGRARPARSRRRRRRRAGRRVSLSYAACIQCRECVTACPEQAVSVSHRRRGRRVHPPAARADRVVRRRSGDGPWHVPRRSTSKRGPACPNRPTACASASAAGSGARFTCARWTRGAATAASWRSPPRRIPLYDLERFGIHLVASPRHADVLLVTGPVTRNMEIALRRTYEAAPEPRVVVAVGACGCSGGIFGEGTYAAVGGVDRVAAGGRLHSRLPAASAGDSQRAAGGDGRS